MKSSRLYVVRGAMVFTLLLICGFQVYWLTQNYSREKQLLRKEVSAILRETGFTLQFGEMDALPRIKVDYDVEETGPGYIKRISNSEVSLKHPDSSHATHTQVMIAVSSKDSVQSHIRWEKSMPGEKTPDTLDIIRTFSVQPIRKEALDSAYRIALDSARIPMRFTLEQIQEEDLDKDDPAVFSTTGIPGSLDHLQFFKAHFTGYVPFIGKRLWPQLLFSLLIICISVFSFVLLYRTLIRQKKLNEQKDQFISNMTHELKTPIATVSVALEAMQNFNVLDDAQRTREYLDISQKELQRLGLLVDKVLKLSMFENNMLEIHPEPLDFEALAGDVCAAMKLQFEKSNVVFSLEREGNDFHITGDRLHLSGVLFNLLDNALKYGGEKPEIRVTLFADETEVRATITDNGNGIAPEYREKIFEKFFRIQQGNRHDVKGYGLGLAYAAGIAKKHGGRITIDSTPDRGSSFTLILPKKNG